MICYVLLCIMLVDVYVFCLWFIFLCVLLMFFLCLIFVAPFFLTRYNNVGEAYSAREVGQQHDAVVRDLAEPEHRVPFLPMNRERPVRRYWTC